MNDKNKPLHFSGEYSWHDSDDIVNELMSFLYKNDFREYSKKYLNKTDYKKFKEYDIDDSACMRWGEDWYHPFDDLYASGIFIENDNGETICDEPEKLMKFLIDHFLSEINEHDEWIKGKVLLDEDVTNIYTAPHELRRYLMSSGLRDRLTKVIKDEDEIDSFFEWLYDPENIPGFDYEQKLGGGPMSEYYTYKIYFIESELQDAIDYILKRAQEYVKHEETE
ncbi:MAG: hypothetical protein HN815_07120 [Candidatus Marinimicrobia bacterium]|jgi:hypothetical protein|nr:hypothetical protein [Candidatus Neomarinimicrobiota bacterium]MBT7373745.1 hypothetical protein [Candidatus Neomarinimicrobiota bacterium]